MCTYMLTYAECVCGSAFLRVCYVALRVCGERRLKCMLNCAGIAVIFFQYAS